MCEALNLPPELVHLESRIRSVRPSECSLDRDALLWKAGWAAAEARLRPDKSPRPAGIWLAAMGGALAASLAWGAAGGLDVVSKARSPRATAPPAASANQATTLPASEAPRQLASLPATLRRGLPESAWGGNVDNLISQRDRALASVWGSTHAAELERRVSTAPRDENPIGAAEASAPTSAATLWRELAPESMRGSRDGGTDVKWLQSLSKMVAS